ncbi:ATP-binding protein, partial [Caballeronia sp. AZ7_KS35]|uniref:ATP-binding protein n=1 Tax=Caballeronia sp. AZ7_KS35 TaxID=2921762 RepID=UPI002027DFFB
MFSELSEQSAHFVRFYDDDALLLAEVADFIDDALRAGGVGIVIATPAHINELRRRLVGFGSVQNPETWYPGQLITLDADDTLAQFMVDDWPDESRFNDVVGTIVKKACGDGLTVNAFGEMVALLCERGLQQAAIRLEQLWNRLAEEVSFSLFCGYPWHLFPTAESADAFRLICEEHHHACSAGHASKTEAGKPDVRLAELEQQARALRTEVARRVTAEQTLKLREKELTDFMENAAEGLHKVAADGTILWANKAELAILGYRWEEYVGHHIAEFHVDRAVIESILERLTNGETIYDQPARLRCRDGRIKHVLIHSNGFFEGEQLRYTRCFTRDATERHQRDQALMQRDRMLLNAPVAAALLSGPNLVLELANRRCCELAGRLDIEGKAFADAFPDYHGSELARLLHQAQATGEPFSGGEVRMVTSSGEQPGDRFLKINLEPLKRTNGEVDSIVFVAVDVTEHVRNRQVLENANLERSALLAKLAEANSAKDEFLAMLGHELRNPLSPIVMALELMRVRGDTTSEKEQQIIRRQVDHMVRLVDDLLDVSRITRGRIDLEITTVDIGHLISKAIEMVSPLFEERGQTLHVDLEDGLRLDGDPVRLTQVLSNLLSNAARYTGNGGNIAVTAIRENEDHLRISVADNGVGISEEVLPRIFELFFQGKRTLHRAKGGLGIGLSLVRSIVDLHRGTVEARSRGPGQGSEFIVRLPVRSHCENTVAPVAAQVIASPVVVRRRRIMLVDDNPDAVDALGM